MTEPTRPPSGRAFAPPAAYMDAAALAADPPIPAGLAPDPSDAVAAAGPAPAAADEREAADAATAGEAATEAQPVRQPDLPPAITLDGAGRVFGKLTAVDGVTASVPAGTILGLVGPSGSGKTTTVRLLTGALRPTHGKVRVLGEDPTRFRRDTRERIGYMPQLFVLYPDLTAEENVSFVGSMFGMLWRRRHRRVREVLQLVDLWEARGRRASELSGGMQRRLELACALVHEPSVLFLDEPTAGIDPLLRQQIWAELRRLRDSGRTLVVTTQYVGEAEYCDNVALLAEGRLLALDTPEGLRRHALGGDVVEIETAQPFDVNRLADVEGVRKVRQRTPTNGFAIVDDAGTATPSLVEAIGAQGVDVTSTREFRPPFDEIFAELVTRSANGKGPGADGIVSSARVDGSGVGGNGPGVEGSGAGVPATPAPPDEDATTAAHDDTPTETRR